jgi:hypothetical protein
MNPFELRFAMLNTAKEMLEAEYHSKKAHEEQVSWPTLEDILARAEALNEFVSKMNK